eukprot:TRINITY_DN7179_c0_g1_i1.p1 TRINITY_DN7179_c0_g1~~TRINITY_DN7179_c0_g1_i1.p1  ORF type:complete len:343 (+),score=65.06 TRINITY_DN7179_c0_g1_i1:163-1191(+)
MNNNNSVNSSGSSSKKKQKVNKKNKTNNILNNSEVSIYKNNNNIKNSNKINTNGENKNKKNYNKNEDEIKISNIIKLNVGGKKYITTRSTIFSKGENFLTILIDNDEKTQGPSTFKDEEGYYFIDRNAEIFALVLDYFRTGVIILEHPSHSRQQILLEYDFYQIYNISSHQLLSNSASSESANKLGYTKNIDKAINHWKTKVTDWLDINLDLLNSLIYNQSEQGNSHAYLTFTRQNSNSINYIAGGLEIPSQEINSSLWRTYLTELFEIYSDNNVHLSFQDKLPTGEFRVTLKWADLVLNPQYNNNNSSSSVLNRKLERIQDLLENVVTVGNPPCIRVYRYT